EIPVYWAKKGVMNYGEEDIDQRKDDTFPERDNDLRNPYDLFSSSSHREYSSFLTQFKLVCSTCYAFDDPIFINRKFDYLIVDEASQIHLLLALIPISRADKFVLIGDHHQLKPFSRNLIENIERQKYCLDVDDKEKDNGYLNHDEEDNEYLIEKYKDNNVKDNILKDNNVKDNILKDNNVKDNNVKVNEINNPLGISLFELLIDRKVDLSIQYRMGRKIMTLANELFYEGKLRGGVVEGEIVYFNSDGQDLIEKENNFCVIKRTTTNQKLKNDTNGNRPLKLETSETVILCYFNSQVNFYRSKGMRSETIDRFQGSESENVIVVFDPVVDCSVLGCRERLNVAITRARRRLILVGDESKMLGIGVLSRLLIILRNREN
ncbi:Protein ZGRF1, partial [Dictyocoela roeselum]